MIKKLFLIVLFIFVFILFTPPARADSEFSSSYNILYEVDQTGLTTVTEKISLKNLTDKFYASNFSLNISATQISEVAATDSQGPLEINYQQEGPKTNIKVNFSQQVAGKGKEYIFTLKYKSKDFAQAQGKIWQVTIPKISSSDETDSYIITLSVPVSFGDPSSILPEPIKQSEADGKLNLNFTKEQLSQSGILANFGLNQYFKFELNYLLDNVGFLPKTLEIALPSSGVYQQIMLTSIEPKPDNTYFDQDGNTIAQFKVNRNEKLPVKAQGLAKIYASSLQKEKLNSTQEKIYTANQKYWDKDSPQIQGKLNEIFQGKDSKTNQEKARLIDNFVVSALTYDEQRIKDNDFSRLGALTALNNPQKALCQEFSDLFIALARAAGIPSREQIGYAYSTNSDLRPLSWQKGQILHSWVEYFDPNLGWVMADPTWEYTTGGVDYFSRFDLGHLNLVTRGVSSTEPQVPQEVRVEFTDWDFTPVSQTNLQLLVPEQFYSGIPAKIKIRIENQGNFATDSAQLKLSSPDLEITGVTQNSFYTPNLPSDGHLEYNFDLKAKSPFDSKEGTIELNWGDQTISKKILIKPFFAHQLFGPILAVVVGFMVLIYISVVIFHLRYHQKFNFEFHKKK